MIDITISLSDHSLFHNHVLRASCIGREMRFLPFLARRVKLVALDEQDIADFHRLHDHRGVTSLDFFDARVRGVAESGAMLAWVRFGV